MATTDSSDHDEEQQMLRVTTAICEAIVSRDYFCDTSSMSVDPLSAVTGIPESDEYDRSLTKKIEQLIKAMASSDMDSKQTEAFLTSQMKRRPHGISSSEVADVVVITETQSAALAKFWMANRARIHEAIVRRSACISSPSIYRGIAWRTHDTSQSRYRPSPDVTSDTTSAVLQITLQNKPMQSQKFEDSIQFQLDGSGVRRLLDCLDEVDARLVAAAATS